MELLQLCREHAHKFYCDLLLAAEKTLSDSLFEQSANCTSNEDQRRYFEAMQRLKERSTAMHNKFSGQLATIFDAFIKGDDNRLLVDQHIDAGNLSLLQRDELEDDLAISVIISKSNSRNSESLWKLNQRMAVLRGGKAVNDDNNPLGPAMVCSAMQAAVAALDVDSKVKILVYKQLGMVFVISFAKEIDALNELLVAKNILPNLRFSASARSSGGQATAGQGQPASSDNPAVEASHTESADSIAHQHELYGAIRALQSAIGPRTQTAGGVSYEGLHTDGTGGADSFSSNDYAMALSAIQQSTAFINAAAANQPLPAEQVEQQLVELLSSKSEGSEHHKMTRDDADTVDLVGMIFRYMLDDENLHDAVKSMLSHLHTPYLKLALIDKTFLDNHYHSARVLLNNMAEVGGKWVKEENDRTVLPKIKTIVETILKGFINDETIFDRLLEDFSRFRDSLEKRAKMVEKRNTESQQGLEKLEFSKQQAVEEISQRLEKANIADHIAELLHKPWSDFLAFNLLRHGDDSLTWEAALKVVDGVIWSVRPEAVADNKDDFHRHQADLELSVSEGLNTIGYDSEASKSLLHALKEAQELAYHSAVMKEVKQGNDQSIAKQQPSPKRQPAPAKTADASKKPSARAIRQQAEQTAAKLSPEELGMVEKLQQIAFGTWFEFDQKTDSRQLKLAWFSRVSSHYMFVDHAGVKQSVETQYNLARGLCAGSIRIVVPTKKSFMERALETILDTLKRS
jgi:hypothetical protein